MYLGPGLNIWYDLSTVKVKDVWYMERKKTV
jgi:hypothetical protein